VSYSASALLVRPRKNTPARALAEYDTKPYFTGSKRGWVLVDLWTASTVVQVHDALNETNREKFAALELLRMVDVAFRLVAKSRAA
jgi:hypothetical protein